jgi:phosphoribosylglycinamide formyltransferase-1
MLTPLHDPSMGVLRVAGLMSGSGTNIRKIIEHQRTLQTKEGASPFEVVVLFTDRVESQAVQIGKDYDLPVVVRDLEAFCRSRGASRRDMAVRRLFDEETVRALSPYGVRVAAYGGYMSIATEPLIEAFIGINVHPADLSIENPDGTRKYTGDHAVRDAILAGERTLRSSTHLIEPEVDGGRLLMISAPMEVMLLPEWDLSRAEDLKAAESYNQERLKKAGDWVIFPRTIEEIARGGFQWDESGNLYHRGRPIPKGLKLD